MVIEPRVMQFWSEIILVISNRTHTVHSFEFEIMHMISAQIALYLVQLPLSIENHIFSKITLSTQNVFDSLLNNKIQGQSLE